MEKEKKCLGCGLSKSINEFHKHWRSPGGIRSKCKICRHYEYYDNRDKILKQTKERYPQKRDEILLYQRKYYKKNTNKIKNRSKLWKKNNKPKTNKNHRKRMKTDIRYKLMHNTRGLLSIKLRRRLINKNGKSTFDILPYTIDDLLKHLENKFQLGMSWNNHNQFGWHIDHIIPDCRFNYTSVEDEEFQKCWALENLQPSWWYNNLRKNK